MAFNNVRHLGKIQKVIAFMKENNHYSIPDLVEISGMSKSRFYDAFVNITGMSPIEKNTKFKPIRPNFCLKKPTFQLKK